MLNTDTPTAPHKGRDYWQKHVNTWMASGGTQSSYCHQHKLSEKLFSLWKNRFIKEQSPSLKSETGFVPVLTKEKTPRRNSVESVGIILPNGIRMDLSCSSSGAAIAELAKHLVVLSC